MSGPTVAVASLVLALLCVLSGMHVAIALGLMAFGGVWLIRGDIEVASRLVAQTAQDAIASHVFGVVPLFILTGLLVVRADIGRDAFAVADVLLRRLRGGLGVATVASNAVFAAITGISIASAAVFSRVAVPPMREHGYRPRFAAGLVAGSSVLGMLIPPSLLMVLYAYLAGLSVGDLFTAGILPGLLLALAFAIGVVVLAHARKDLVFAPDHGMQPMPADAPGLLALLPRLVPALAMLLVIVGGLYSGFFTATEVGAVGAGLALLLAAWRRKLGWDGLRDVLIETGHVTVAVSFLIICATCYARMLAMSGLPTAMASAMGDLGPWTFVAAYLVVVIALGTVLDSSSTMLIVLPLALPLAEQFALDLVWFGVVTVIAVEIGLLTPPFGVSVYVVKSALNDPGIGLGDVFRGTTPFTLIMAFVLLLVVAFPQLSLALL